MSNLKDGFSRIAFAVVLAWGSTSLTTRAHTEAVGYVVVSPGVVDVWFGTYHRFSQSPQTEGQALLTQPNNTQISQAFTLTSPTVPLGLNLGQNLIISPNYSLSDMQSWQGTVFHITQTGTYSVTLDPAFPTRSSKWRFDFGNPISFNINPRATVSNRGLTTNQQGPLQGINQALLANNSTRSFARLNLAIQQTSTPVDLGQALEQLSPVKFGNFASTTAFNNESFETAAMDMYLENQRDSRHGGFVGGNGEIDSSGLTINDPNVDPGLQLVHSRMLAWNAPSGAVSDLPSALLGGVDMKEAKKMVACDCEPSSPWNVFIRGSVILGQGYSQADIPHFDDNTAAVVIGADYRFTPHLLAGLTLGYAHTDVTLDSVSSSATVDGYSPGLYASYTDGGWFANLQGRYSYNSYTQDRRIGFLNQNATSATDGNEGVANLDGGYEFHHGDLTYGPIAGLQYTHLTVNGYRESGSDANLLVREDQSDSLRSRAGFELKYALHSHGTTISPHLNASWQHEFFDQSRGITSAFANFNSGSFNVRTQNVSQDSALVDAGVDAKVTQSVNVFADYLVQAGQDNYFGQSVQAGVKVNF